jgi:D-alanine-D-alanine ligase
MSADTRPPILLLYGIDAISQQFEVDSTLKLVDEATHALSELGWRVMPQQVAEDLDAALKPWHPDTWVVLNLCEGTPQQASYYAAVTRVLAQRGYCFTGSDAFSLNETQYKWRMKELLDAAHVPTPPWALCTDASLLSFSQFPAIVKPAAEHCSYGITRDSVVLNLDEARAQTKKIIEEFHAPAMIEAFLDSAEYNVSVWGSENHPAGFEVLGISMMTYDFFTDVRDRLCTFEAKWDPSSLAYQKIPATCPAPVTPELRAMIERVAIDAYKASRCRDYGRVDIRLLNGLPMALDVNSNCDVSSDGGFMNAARARGMTYGQMLERLIDLALVRRTPTAAVSSPRQPATRLSVVDATPADQGVFSDILLNSGVFGQSDVECVDDMFTETWAKPRDDGYRWLIARDALGTAQGFACYGPESLTYNTWDLFWICARESARGTGVGRALINEAIARARAAGARLMVIYTSSTGAYAPARRLYEAAGFAQTATIPDYYNVGDSLHIYAMQLSKVEAARRAAQDQA